MQWMREGDRCEWIDGRMDGRKTDRQTDGQTEGQRMWYIHTEGSGVNECISVHETATRHTSLSFVQTYRQIDRQTDRQTECHSSIHSSMYIQTAASTSPLLSHGPAPLCRIVCRVYSHMSDVQSPPGYRTSCANAGPNGSAPKSTRKFWLMVRPPLSLSTSTCSITDPLSTMSG